MCCSWTLIPTFDEHNGGCIINHTIRFHTNDVPILILYSLCTHFSKFPRLAAFTTPRFAFSPFTVELNSGTTTTEVSVVQLNATEYPARQATVQLATEEGQVEHQ